MSYRLRANTGPRDVHGPGSFPIVRRPAVAERRAVVVSIPHYGTEPLPGIGPEVFAEPELETLPAGFADPFAAEIYGDLARAGAGVVATPYSRLFVDVNWSRDDFTVDAGHVESSNGVVKTCFAKDRRGFFHERLPVEEVEARLAAFYDPYHDALRALVEETSDRFGAAVLIDAHTAIARRIGDSEVVIGSRRAKTADGALVDIAAACFRAHGFAVERDVPGYAGGHITRSYGRLERGDVHAVQIEINSRCLMAATREEHIARQIRGEPPLADPGAIERARASMADAVSALAEALPRLGGGATA